MNSDRKNNVKFNQKNTASFNAYLKTYEKEQ